MSWTIPLSFSLTLLSATAMNKTILEVASQHSATFPVDQIKRKTFLASWDAIEPMWLTESVRLLNRLDWCDPGEWRYLLKTLLMSNNSTILNPTVRPWLFISSILVILFASSPPGVQGTNNGTSKPPFLNQVLPWRSFLFCLLSSSRDLGWLTGLPLLLL